MNNAVTKDIVEEYQIENPGFYRQTKLHFTIFKNAVDIDTNPGRYFFADKLSGILTPFAYKEFPTIANTFQKAYSILSDTDKIYFIQENILPLFESVKNFPETQLVFLDRLELILKKRE